MREPWCPFGASRCTCAGTGSSYTSAPWRSPNQEAASAPFRIVSGTFAQYNTSHHHRAEQCTPKHFAQARNACLPDSAHVSWAPDRWHLRALRPKLPVGVTASAVDRACDGIRVHIARAEWAARLRDPLTHENVLFFKYGPKHWIASRDSRSANGTATRAARKAQCVERLSGFAPKVCSIKNVLVWGHARRLISANSSTYYLPPEVVREQSAHDKACPENCRARSKNVIACGGHAVIGRNLMGTAYYHTLYETFGSIAFALDLLMGARAHGHTSTPSSPPIRLLENICIPADGSQSYMNMRSRSCNGGSAFGPGPARFFADILQFLGIQIDQLQHYPYVRQWDGPAVHLDRATFDCSPAVYRNFWHGTRGRVRSHI